MRYRRGQYLESIYLTTDTTGCILRGMVKIEVPGYRCHRCSHEWVPRNKDQKPRVCPKCKSPYWDRPRRTKKP
jgi:predicted Zn-ribbon and HTH transcriptional regulator